MKPSPIGLSALVRIVVPVLSFLVPLLLLPIAGAASAAPRPSLADQPAETSLPLLPRGQTLGTTLFGSAGLDSLDPETLERYRGATETGLDGFTLYVDWADLESAPGVLDEGEIEDRLDDLNVLGLKIFVNITVIDIGEYNLPADLSDGTGGLAPGIRLDDADVTARFGTLLDQLVPLLVERGVFLLGLGNEVDERLDDAPAAERLAYAGFLAGARDRVNAIAPELPASATLTAPALLSDSPTRQAIENSVDLVAFNYAPIDPDWFVLDEADIEADFRAVLDAAGAGPLVIQELSCPDAPLMGAGPAWQAGCFGTLLDVVRTTPTVRFASIFSLEDFDGATCDAIQAAFEPLLTDTPEDFQARFLQYLCRLGILDPDGAAKPAWITVTDRAARLPSLSRRLQALVQRDEVARPRLRLRKPGSGLRSFTLPIAVVAAADGSPRRYSLFVPPGEPPQAGWPFVVHFHGGGGTAEAARIQTRWDVLAANEGFVVAFGEGTRPDHDMPPAFARNPQTWNDGTGRSAIGAVARGEDDLGYFEALLDDVAGRVPIDRHRIHATGFSNGAGMTLNVARNLPERLASAAAVAGKDVQDPSLIVDSPLSLLYMTGTADPLNPVDGGEVFLFGQPLGTFPPVAELFDRWLERLACAQEARPLASGPPDVAAQRHFPCAGNATAELWLIEGHGHHWPGGVSLLPPSAQTGPDTTTLDATAVIWSFFENTRRAQVHE